MSETQTKQLANTLAEITIDLDYIYTANNKEVDQLKMRPPRVQDTMIAKRLANDPKDNHDIECELIASICRVEREFIDQLHECDFDKVQQARMSFLSSRLKKRLGF